MLSAEDPKLITGCSDVIKDHMATTGRLAPDIGAFHEAFNLAALWSLPVLFEGSC